MLVKISVENFKSFDGVNELSMVSSSKIRTHENHRVKVKSTQLLKNAIIYGANASGKTNLIDFFVFFKKVTAEGLLLDSSQMFCKNKKENKLKNSTFEIQFTYNNKFYAYGFSAILSEQKIIEEWLYQLNQDGSAKCLFECELNKKPKLGDMVTLSELDKKKFDVYAEDYNGNYQHLFLTEMNRGKSYNKDSKLMFFREVYDWIQNHIVVFTPKEMVTNLDYFYDDHSLELINKLIQTFDTGIAELSIEEISADELAQELPKRVLQDIMKQISLRKEDKNSKVMGITIKSNNSFFNISFLGLEEPKITTLRIKHHRSFYDFVYKEESDGTRRIFEFMDMLLNKQQDTIYVVDELERSLHPKLTAHFLELFMQSHQTDKIQLLFTTHESTIMDQDLFRRDEIWFIERNSDNVSNIYSLDKFKERYDRILSKAYLEGRYGAIPILSSFDFSEEV